MRAFLASLTYIYVCALTLSLFFSSHFAVFTACDVIARFMRLSGREVFFLSGTDEHGQKVQASAAAKGIPPQDFVNAVSQNFLDLSSLLNISIDQFIRTTQQNHKESVQFLWNVLVEKGYIYLGTYEGWYSVRDECFYMESELTKDGLAPTGAPVEWVAKEESYFFKLSAFQDKLLEFYEQHPDFIAPDSRKNEVVSFVKSGLRDLSVSRTSFSWGVPVPGDAGHVMYVWIDALANYISALGYPNTSNNDSPFAKFWPAALHVVGKDIIRFHAVYWPAMLMAADLPVPKRLFAHGWWTKDGQKISKSLGNVIDPVELCEKVCMVFAGWLLAGCAVYVFRRTKRVIMCQTRLKLQRSCISSNLTYFSTVRRRSNAILSHVRSCIWK
jgi:methionyl-tRNA synthetase